MLSDTLRAYARSCWLREKEKYGTYAYRLETELEKVSSLSEDAEDIETLLMLLYGTLPASDVASVSTDLLLSYIRHSLMLRRESPFCRDIPEDVFVHYVFYPRINSEDLCDCRPFFAGQLLPRLAGRSAQDAALEVNRWCAENMTYEMSDTRTENPMTAYLAGLGRCGEESTFAVTAYRSVGIPARQIYVPYWVHCDDNHAWVEIKVDGRWYFLGACEPEPVLNRGWFTDASSRAPLALGRSFLAYVGEGLKEEAILDQRDCLVFFNVLPHYAPSTELTIRVEREDGTPVEGAVLRLEVPNMAAFRPVVTGTTDARGSYTVTLGRADFHLEVYLKDQENSLRQGPVCSRQLKVRGERMEQVIVAGPGEEQYSKEKSGSSLLSETVVSEDYIPPLVSDLNRTVLSEEEKEEKARTLSYCERTRRQRIDSYMLPVYQTLDAEWIEILRLAGGHAAELYSLLENLSPDRQLLLKEILKNLTSKDYRDVDTGLLQSVMRRIEREEAAGGQQNNWQELLQDAGFAFRLRYIYNPRIRYELMEDWSTVLTEAYSREEQEMHAACPEKFRELLDRVFSDPGLRWYPVLSLQPAAMHKLGAADAKGRDLYFVAALRTFGLAARINPVDEAPEYWREGFWHKVRAQKSETEQAECRLKLRSEEEKDLVYGQNFSLSRLCLDHYQPLDYAKEEEIDRAQLQFSLPQGRYRLLTTNRLPNGSQLIRATDFTLASGKERELWTELRTASPKEMLNALKLEPFYLQASDQTLAEPLSSDSLITGPSLILYPVPGEEPTEHLLNELLDHKTELGRAVQEGLGILLVLSEGADLDQRTLRLVLDTCPGIRCLREYRDTSITLARTMFQEPGVWPLLILTDETLTGYFASCGYHVGSVDLILKLWRLL